MLDLNNMLAGGGIAAAVVAGWSQVKNAFSYLSSFVIVNVHVDHMMTWAVRDHLRYHDWKILPGGSIYYRCEVVYSKLHSMMPIIPFRLPANKAIYRRGFQFLFVSLEEDKSSFMYIRGTLDCDAFIKKSVQLYEARDKKSNEEYSRKSRYRIEKVIGAEKGLWANKSRASNQLDSVNPSVSPSTSAGSINIKLDVSRDKSFMYDSSFWMTSVNDDPFEALYFPDHILAYIEQARKWKSMGDWYRDRMIPYRRGWLLVGPPGTGKSSMAKGTAQDLGIPIYQYFLSTLSDQEFMSNWADMVGPCVALLEDFDNIFRGRENITESKLLTFDCVLNQISGVSAVNGVFLIVTTNDLSSIDPAMGVTWAGEGVNKGVSTRPDRIDTVIEIGFMDKANRYKLAKRILRDWPEAIDALVNENDNVTPVQFQEICIQFAYSKLSESNVIQLERKHA